MFSDLHQVQWESVSATKTCLMFFGFLVQAMGTCFLKKLKNYRPLKAGHGHGRACNGQRGSQALLGKKGNGKVSKNALYLQNQGFDLQGISFSKISSDQRHYLPNQNVFQLR